MDEQDFYEIAGDADAVRQISAIRADQEFQQQLGVWGGAGALTAGCVGASCLGLGGAALLGAVVVPVAGFVLAPLGFMACALAPAAGLVGAGAGAGGLLMARVARNRLVSPGLVLPLERARAAADAYNKRFPAHSMVPQPRGVSG